MPFMEPYIYGPTTGVIVENKHGEGATFPGFVWDDLPEDDRAEYVTIEEVCGYFGRYSAAGYMDCTDWSFDEDVDALEVELREMYGDDEEGD